MKKYNHLFRIFFPMLFIVAAQNLVSFGVNLMDNIMLGSYSEGALAGAALVNQIQFLLMFIVTGMGRGLSVICSQYWGKSETAPIRNIISLGLKFAVGFGMLFALLTAFLPQQILGLLTNDAGVIAQGAEYLRIMCWTYIIYSVSMILMSSLIGVQTAHVGTIMSCSTLVINVCLNYILIFGHFGAPELGITGAAIATLTSRLVELAIVVIYILRIDKKLKFKFRELLRFDFTYLRDFIITTMPMVITGAMWGVAQAAQTAIIGHISATAIAAQSIAAAVYQIFSVFCWGAGSAAQVAIGKTIGETIGYAAGETRSGRKSDELIGAYSRVLQLIFIAIGIITGATIFLCKSLIVGIYDVSTETHTLALAFLSILSISVVGTCYEYPVQGGIVAGGGDTAYAAIVDNIFMWLITIPTASLSAFVFRWPPEVTFIFLKSDQVLKCIPNAIYVNRFRHRWLRVLTR